MWERLLALFCLLACAAYTAGNTLWLEGPTRSHFQSADDLALVQPTQVGTRETVVVFDRVLKQEREQAAFIQEFRVVGARKLSKGQTVKLIFTKPGVYSVRPNLQLNRTYLVALDSAEDDGWVRNWSVEVAEIPVLFKLPKAVEHCVLFAIPSPLKELKPSAEIADAIQINAVESLFMPRDDVSRSVVKLLYNAGPPKTTRRTAVPAEYSDYGKEPPMVPVGIPDDLSRRVERAREINSGYRKSKAAELLVRWRMPGSVKPYVASLIPLLGLPGVYLDSEAEGQGAGLILRLIQDYRSLDGVVGDEPETELKRMLSATNPKLLHMWLMNFGGPLDQDQLKRFGQLLRWGDQDVIFMVIQILSSQLQEPTQAARLSGSRDGMSIPYPDLEEKRAYWMRRLGIKP